MTGHDNRLPAVSREQDEVVKGPFVIQPRPIGTVIANEGASTIGAERDLRREKLSQYLRGSGGYLHPRGEAAEAFPRRSLGLHGLKKFILPMPDVRSDAFLVVCGRGDGFGGPRRTQHEEYLRAIEGEDRRMIRARGQPGGERSPRCRSGEQGARLGRGRLPKEDPTWLRGVAAAGGVNEEGESLLLTVPRESTVLARARQDRLGRSIRTGHNVKHAGRSVALRRGREDQRPALALQRVLRDAGEPADRRGRGVAERTELQLGALRGGIRRGHEHGEPGLASARHLVPAHAVDAFDAAVRRVDDQQAVRHPFALAPGGFPIRVGRKAGGEDEATIR